MAKRRFCKKVARQTKATTWRWFERPHEHLRRRFSWYHHWHQHPHANKVHLAAALTASVTVLVVVWAAFNFPGRTHAATYTRTWTSQADFTTDVTNSQLDTNTTAGSVKLAANPSPAMSYNSTWGGVSMYMVYSTAVDSNGNVYAVDNSNYRVVKFDSSGQQVWWLGCSGTTPGPHTTGPSNSSTTIPACFGSPYSVSVDSSNNIYVSDYNTHRVVKFDSNGNFIWWLGYNGSTYGTHTTGNGSLTANPGGLRSPYDVAFDVAGNIYVSEYGNNRVSKFDSNGNFIWWLGYDGSTIGTHTSGTPTSGTAPGMFTQPQGVSLDSSGNILVAEYGNNRVQKFDSNGNFIWWLGYDGSTYGTHTSGVGVTTSSPGGFARPYKAIVRSSDGNIFVTQQNNGYAQQFDTNGNYLAQISYNNSSTRGIALDAANNLYIAAVATIGKYDTANVEQRRFGIPNVSGTSIGMYGGSSGPNAVALDSAGNMYIADYYNYRVLKYDSTGNFLWWTGYDGATVGPHTSNRAGVSGSAAGRLNGPYGISIDAAGNIYVADTSNYRVQKFDSNGNFIWWLGYDGSTYGTHTSGAGVASSDPGGFKWVYNGPRFDQAGNMYILDSDMSGNSGVQKFDSNGNFIWWFGYDGSTTGFHTTGTRAFGSDNGQFKRARDIVFDSQGNMYVMDSGNYRIQKFDSAGNFVWWSGYDGSTVGAHTSGLGVQNSSMDGAFSSPGSMQIDSAGNLYISDSNTVKVFSSATGSFIRKSNSTTLGYNNDSFYSIGEIVLSADESQIYAPDGNNFRIKILDNAVTYYHSGVLSGTGLQIDANSTATWSSLSWNETLPANTVVKFRVATSEDGATWSGWSDYYTDASAPYSVSLLGTPDSRYLKVEVTLEGGMNTPQLDDLTVTYVQNGAPVVSNLTANQSTASASYGKVNLAYNLADYDTGTAAVSYYYNLGSTLGADLTSGATTLTVNSTANLPSSGTVIVDDEIMTYTGKTDTTLTGLSRAQAGTIAVTHSSGVALYALCMTTTGGGAGIATGTDGHDYTATWNAKQDVPNVYTTTAKIKVVANDGQLAHMIGSGVASNVTIDTTNPVAGAIDSFTGVKIGTGATFVINRSVDLTLSATDDSTLYMEVRNDNAFTGTNEAYAASKTGWQLSANDGAKTVRVRFIDQYGNYTDASASVLLDTTPPDTPSSFKLFDASDYNSQIYSIIVAWNADADPGDFQEYALERSTGDGNWTSLATFSNVSSDIYYDKGLSGSVTYSYRLRAIDIHANISAYTDVQSLQPEGTDTVPPTITGPGPTSTVSDVTATISWITDKPSDSYVEFGTTNEYGLLQGSDDLSVNHSVTLIGLQPATTYHFRVKSRDVFGNRVVSISNTFTTDLPQEAADGVSITGSTAQKPGADPEEVTIIWTTDRYASSQVWYGVDADNLDQKTVEDTTLNKTHFVSIVHLEPNTKYYYKAYSKDTYGNEVWGEQKYFVTAQSGLSNPTIGSVEASDVSLNSAIVSWTTTTVTTSMIQIGTEPGVYTQSVEDASLGSTTNHVIKLTGLAQGQTYHFRVLGAGTDQRYVASDDYTFATLPLPVISNIQIESVTSDAAVISWQMNTPSTSVVNYGVTSLTDSQGDATTDINHRVTLRSLEPATSYRFEIQANDRYGNVVRSETRTFSTVVDAVPPSIKDIKSEVSIITDQAGNTTAQAIVSWSTDEPATSQVKYAMGVAAADDYPLSTTEDANLTTSHVVIISGLKPSSTYHMRLLSHDASNNLAVSDDYTVLTLNQQKSLLQYIVQILEDKFSWLKGLGLSNL